MEPALKRGTMKRANVMQSMTGFASREARVAVHGAFYIELRSINHKALETVMHLPEGYAALESAIKKEIETKIKRGRVTCSLSVAGGEPKHIFINKGLLCEYLYSLKHIKKEFDITDEVSVNTLIHLPGVLSLLQHRIDSGKVWPRLKTAVAGAIDDLVRVRKNEGKALCLFLREAVKAQEYGLKLVKMRFKTAVDEKLAAIKIDEERTAFLKSTDITEEIERLSFHINAFKLRLGKPGPMGKELDFIAQEMQREANTMAAKSFDLVISHRVIQIKSQTEKMREQLQNVE